MVWVLIGFGLRLGAVLTPITITRTLPSELWHCWVGDSKDMRPEQSPQGLKNSTSATPKGSLLEASERLQPNVEQYPVNKPVKSKIGSHNHMGTTATSPKYHKPAVSLQSLLNYEISVTGLISTSYSRACIVCSLWRLRFLWEQLRGKSVQISLLASPACIHTGPKLGRSLSHGSCL